METIVSIILIVVGIILFCFFSILTLFHKYSELLKKLTKFENRLTKLENHFLKPIEMPMEQAVSEEKPEPVPVEVETPPLETAPDLEKIEPEPPKEEAPPPEEKIELTPIEATTPKEEPSVPYRILEPSPEVYPGKSEYWSRIEKQFIDNWTGILGSVIMVIGVAFLSIYAALKLAPFFRFLMLTGFAVVLFSVFFVLRAKSKWLKLAVWLRSSGSAVFLFGCLGSGTIPGLKWIDSAPYSMGLLLLGVVLNLVVGFISGTQFFASLHSIISLAALAIAPQSQLTLAIAVGISLFQVLMTYRARWEYHLLVTIMAFLAYHLYWVYSLDLLSRSPMPLNLRFTGIAATAVIGIGTALVHYREAYAARAFDRLPFIVHLLNWLFMGIGFFVYSTGSKWNTFVLTAAALAAFFLSRRAKKLGIRWLFITDTLIAQSLALLAISTLPRWGLTIVPISTILMLEVIVFLSVMLREEEEILQWFGGVLFHLSGLMLILAAFKAAQSQIPSRFPLDAGLLAVTLVVYTAFHFYLVRRKSESFDSFRLYGMEEISENFSLSGVIIGLLGIVIFSLVDNFLWSPYAAAVAVSTLLLLRQRYQLRGLDIGTLLMVLGIYLLGWHHLRTDLLTRVLDAAIYGLPFLAIAIVGTRTSYIKRLGKYRKHLWIYLFSIHLALYSFTVLNPISPLAPGTLWLLFVPLYFESSLFLFRRFGSVLREKGEPHRFLLHWGYIFIALFIVRHLMVHIQSNLHIGVFSVRLLQELLALTIFIYWALAKKSEEDQCRSWISLHPLMWELAIVFSILTVVLEVGDIWHPVAWVIGAFLLLILGNIGKERISRFRFYSLLLYWAAAFHIAFISTMDLTPARFFTQQAWFGGFMALLLQLGFVVLFYRKASLDKVELPEPVSIFRGWLEKICRRPHLWIYYPYFLAVALFLYWTFSRSLLTLLWVVETFVIFTLSIVLRENHFRYVAMLGLGACLIRLVFFDLARSGTFTRAVVFLGVGIIMIVMNSLYNKYRERFNDE